MIGNKTRPEDLLTFVYLDEFITDWKTLAKKDTDELWLWELEIAIMSDPRGPKIIKGTGGLRKIRLAKFNANGEMVSGKSGGIRVCYAYFEDFHLVLMVMAYDKNEKDNLSAAERKAIHEYLLITENWLRSANADL